jgi:hypothetical protein
MTRGAGRLWGAGEGSTIGTEHLDSQMSSPQLLERQPFRNSAGFEQLLA